MKRKTQYLIVVLVGVLAFMWGIMGTSRPQASGLEVLVATSPDLWVTPIELDFGPVGVGDTSATQSVTVTNIGDAILTNFAGGAPSDSQFNASQNCAGGVSPGESCQYSFTFTPAAAGAFTSTSNSSTNAGPFSITLHGTGVGPELTVSPFSLDFGSVFSSTTSAQQIVTIRNTGLAPLTNFAGGAPFDTQFNASQNCAGGVAPGGSCQYFFTFTPTAIGTFTTTSNTSTNAGPFTVALQARGRTLIFGSGQRVTPRGIDFGPVGVGTTSGPIAVTVTNESVFSAITGFAGGGVSEPFSASQNCAPSVSPGGTCQFFYSFSPTASGAFSTTSNVSDSFGSFSIELRGTGVGASLTVSPLALDFGPVPLFTTSATQEVTLRNTGPITLTNFAGGGVSPPFNASQNCAGGVPPGGSCQYFFTFTPTDEGRFSAVSSSSTNGGSFSIQLYGGEGFEVYLPVIER